MDEQRIREIVREEIEKSAAGIAERTADILAKKIDESFLKIGGRYDER